MITYKVLHQTFSNLCWGMDCERSLGSKLSQTLDRITNDSLSQWSFLNHQLGHHASPATKDTVQLCLTISLILVPKSTIHSMAMMDV